VTRTSATTHWVAECFWPGVRDEDLQEVDRRVVALASGLTERAQGPAYLGALRITDDEVVLFLFEGPMESVRQLVQRAGIRATRILHCTRTSAP
jgi:hypothetical protein